MESAARDAGVRATENELAAAVAQQIRVWRGAAKYLEDRHDDIAGFLTTAAEELDEVLFRHTPEWLSLREVRARTGLSCRFLSRVCREFARSNPQSTEFHSARRGSSGTWELHRSALRLLPDQQTIRTHRHRVSPQKEAGADPEVGAPFRPDPDVHYVFVATEKIEALRAEPGDVVRVVLRESSPVVVSIPLGPEAVGVIAWNRERLRLCSELREESDTPAADWRPDLRLV